MLGTKWQSVTGRLRSVSVGLAGVWGVSPRHEVMVRDGTWGLGGEAEGTGWTRVDGMMVSVASGDNGMVWGVSEDGGLWYRSNVSQASPMGTHWFRINDGLDMGWKNVALLGHNMWAIDSKDSLLVRDNVKQDNIQGRYCLTIMNQQ